MFKKLCFFFLILSLAFYANAFFRKPAPKIPTPEEIHTLVQLPQAQGLSTGDKIAYFSGLFIRGEHKARMQWGSLGEGEFCDYDCKPLYRFDVFDCTTFVEMMLALATTNPGSDANQSVKNFQKQVIEIRYYHPDKISYVTRNHFPEVDWIPHNTRPGGLLTDITGSIGITKVLTPPAVINKKDWYAHKKLSDVCVFDTLCSAPKEVQKEKLVALQAAGQAMPNETVTMWYLPITDILASNAQSLAKIPNGSIIQFVRPNWNVDGITQMHVVHQGIVVQDEDGTWLHHASSLLEKMQRVSLLEYLERYQRCTQVREPERCVQGINILTPV